MSWRRSAIRYVVALLAASVSVCAPASALAATSHPLRHHPSIASLSVSPSTVAHGGGVVHLKATVHHSTTCKATSSPVLSGLPSSHGCSSGHFGLVLHVGADPGSGSRHFHITVTASKGSHHTTRTVTLTQAAAKPGVSGFAVSPTHLSSAGGHVHLTATVKHAATCELSVSPAVAGLPVALPCTSSSFSHNVALPANTASASKSYLFTLTAHGSGGHVTASNHPKATVAKASATGPISTLTASEAALPAGGSVGDAENANLSSVSCPSAGHCVAVGYFYSPTTGDEIANESGLIDTLNGSTWTATAAPQPSDIDPNEPAVSLNSVSCSSSTACTAVGYYLADNSGEEPYVATLSATTWTWQPASVPADGPDRIGGQLLSVSCATDGGCVAVGKSAPPGDDADALIEQPAVSGWTGTEAPLPLNADPEESDGTEIQDILYDVSCTSSTSCSAVGGYTTGSGETLSAQGMADTLTGSGWTSTEVAPTGEEGYDNGVSCGSDICEGIGEFDTNVPEIQTESGGVWNPVDATIAPQPTAFNGTGLDAVDCTTGSSCVSVGEANGPTSGVYALIDAGSDTTYSDLAAPVPSNAGSTIHSVLSAVSCAAAGSCMAVGFYNGTDAPGGYFDGLLETETTTNSVSSWSPTEAPLPADDDNPGTLRSVSCVSSWGCIAIGSVSPTGDNAVGEIVAAPL